jgi:hypothetical protein
VDPVDAPTALAAARSLQWKGCKCVGEVFRDGDRLVVFHTATCLLSAVEPSSTVEPAAVERFRG